MSSIVATLLAAAEGAEEHSEGAFYIAGGVLALFAVVVAAAGISKPDFPGSDGAARGLMALSALLVGAAMFFSVYVAVA